MLVTASADGSKLLLLCANADCSRDSWCLPFGSEKAEVGLGAFLCCLNVAQNGGTMGPNFSARGHSVPCFILATEICRKGSLL